MIKKKSFLFALLSCLLCISAHAQWSVDSFEHNGIYRSYKIYTPLSYNPSEPAPLVMVLHGLGGTMNDVDMTNISTIADTAGFITISPQAVDYTNPIDTLPGAWNSGIVASTPFGDFAINSNIDDVGFLNALLDTAILHLNIDTNRVFITGFSMGGFMSQRLACESTDRFRAIASMGGTYAHVLPSCQPSKKIPIAHFHGTNDNVVTWDGFFPYMGLSLKVGLSVDTLIRNWAINNDCNLLPDEYHTWTDSDGDGLYVEHYLYKNAENRTMVELFKINKGDHIWYDYDNTNGDLDLGQEVWNFFYKNSQEEVSSQKITIDELSIELFPNPANDFLYIKRSNDNKKLKILISNLTGQVVLNQAFDSTPNINIATLSSGIYFIKVKSNSGEIWNGKFVKM